MTEGSIAITWSARETAMRGLIELALHRRSSTVNDTSGRAVQKLLDYTGIPGTDSNRNYVSNVIRKMTGVGLVERHMNRNRTRTYEVTLVNSLADDRLHELEKLEEGNMSHFANDNPTSDDPASELERLIRDCSEAYAALQRVAKDSSTRVRTGGTVAINVTGVLSAIGINRGRGQCVRYYLRILGLISSEEKVADNDNRHLWWWSIGERPLNIELLTQLATGEQSYERHQDNSRGVPKAGPVTVRHMEPTAPRPATSTVTDREHATESVVDPLVALTSIAERLDRENTQLREQVRTLQGQLDAHQKASHRASDLIARLGS